MASERKATREGAQKGQPARRKRKGPPSLETDFHPPHTDWGTPLSPAKPR
jgi:hypothetical protein